MPARLVLTDQFREAVNRSGLTHAALAKGMDITPQFFSAVWADREPVTARFMAGALESGLVHRLDQIAVLAPDRTKEGAVA